MKLYDELGEELKDPKSFTDSETILITFTPEETDVFMEVFISAEYFQVLEYTQMSKEQGDAGREYCEKAKQAIRDHAAFVKDDNNTKNSLYYER